MPKWLTTRARPNFGFPGLGQGEGWFLAAEFDLTAPGVTPDVTASPKIFTAPPYFEAPTNYRKMLF